MSIIDFLALLRTFRVPCIRRHSRMGGGRSLMVTQTEVIGVFVRLGLFHTDSIPMGRVSHFPIAQYSNDLWNRQGLNQLASIFSRFVSQQSFDRFFPVIPVKRVLVSKVAWTGFIPQVRSRQLRTKQKTVNVFQDDTPDGFERSVYKMLQGSIN